MHTCALRPPWWQITTVSRSRSSRLAIAIEFGEPGRHAAHRHRHRTLDPADFQFPGFAHVEQQRRRLPGVVEALGELARRDLLHRRLRS